MLANLATDLLTHSVSIYFTAHVCRSHLISKISIACSDHAIDHEFMFRWWIDQQPADVTKPALVAAAATPPSSATKRLSGWEAGAKKDTKGDGGGGGSCNVTSELK